ncbi:trypsin-like peptidase domain-containing protein [Bacillus tianshenii]|nr:trypsin-like peptidase domain-containing protein [Bacillus tianshenii]
MGYYDQHVSKKKSSSKWIKYSVFGGVVGSMITSLFFVIWLTVGQGSVIFAKDDDNRAVNSSEAKIENNQSDVQGAVEKVSDAVVSVNSMQRVAMFGEEQAQAGTGSGVIYKKADGKAYIVTNNHVVEDSESVEVTLTDGTKESAKIIGTDPLTDLAVLQIDGKHVKTVAELGGSENLQLGEPVIAIGNPLGQRFAGSVTQGIISGLNRDIPVDLNGDGKPDWQSEVIQTDAAINPGNSGGALVNMKGQIVGINSMKISKTSVEGIGLAIPSSAVKPIIEDLEIHHEVERPYIGVALQALSDIPQYHWQETLKLPEGVKDGVAVLEVVPGSPADKANLKKYDVLVSLDGQSIKDDMDLRKFLYTKKKIGESMKVTFYRNGEKQTEVVKLVKDAY